MVESEWVGRYQDGYITLDGERVTLSDERRVDHGWESPDAARQVWKERGDFDSRTTQMFGNGKLETDDVRMRPEFKSFGITAIWRAITFERRTLN